MVPRRYPGFTKLARQRLRPAAGLNEDEALSPRRHAALDFFPQDARLVCRTLVGSESPLNRNGSPLAAVVDTTEPVGKLRAVSERRREPDDLQEGIQATRAHERSFEPGAPPGVPEQVQLVDDEQADLREPAPVAAPMPGARVEAFRRHDQQPRLLERNGERLALAVLPGEDSDLDVLEPLAPPLDEFVGKGSERGDVDGPSAVLEGGRNCLFSEPGLAGPGGHLQHAVESAGEQATCHDLLFVRDSARRSQLRTGIALEHSFSSSPTKYNINMRANM